MRYCRFLLDGQTHYGKVEERKGELWVVGPARAPEEDLGFRIEHGRPESWSTDFEPLPLRAARLLAPCTPSKIVCVGRNYRDHVREMGNEVPAEPLLFFKPVSALLAPGGAIKLPSASRRIDYEGELVVVIGRSTRNLGPDEDWRRAIRGFTLANDVSDRILQQNDDQWTRAKGFDTFCPLGPLVSDELDPDAGVTIETRVNGELRQQASTRDLIFSVAELLRAISAVMTLEPGDLVLTGTPAGVGPLKAGDRVAIAIPGLGILENTVENA
jgi:2-keto-4-pentenoate hydratase/2-oxohepta-3-ene-1,7-dioic acid hydratase in catechol pathway